MLADWLTECGVTSAAMESTGVEWIPLFQILSEREFQVFLVNAKSVKTVPGRIISLSILTTTNCIDRGTNRTMFDEV